MEKNITNQTSLKLLKDFLKIKSVSAIDANRNDMQKAREFLLKVFQENGFKTKILKGEKHDLVFAEKTVDNKKPTVLIYGHYDVMPEDPVEEWKTPPFSPTINAGQIYARGASDDKGQIMANIIAGFETKDINLKYIIEGEEEIGSISIAKIASKYKDLLKCDYLLVSDSEMLENGTPTIDINLRGLTYMEITLKTAKHDLHSGAYGGVASNPAIILANIITKLKNDKGKILIPGFYEDVLLPSASVRSDFAKVPVSHKSLKNEGEFFVVGGGEPQYSLNERRWARPTLDVNGLTSGYQDPGSKTIIPSKASAKISMRLVPNQDPTDIAKKFTDYVKSLVPKNAELTEIKHSGALPYAAPTSLPIYDIAKKCLTKAFGKKCIFDGVGGSIGFVPIVAKALNVPCLLIGIGKPSDNIHAPNEHLSVKSYLLGIKAIKSLLNSIGSKND